jgi:hypothetical protein
VVELAFERSGDLISRTGRASPHSIGKRIIDAAVDGTYGIKESRRDGNLSLTVAVAHGGKPQADTVGKRVKAVVILDKFFEVHRIDSLVLC